VRRHTARCKQPLPGYPQRAAELRIAAAPLSFRRRLVPIAT
jgi:hypothetical protein